MRCEEPPETEEILISWGCSAGRRVFQPPEKEKTSFSWGSSAGTNLFQPPEKEKTSIPWGGFCRNKIDIIEICLNTEIFMGAGEEERFHMIQRLQRMIRVKEKLVLTLVGSLPPL